MEDLMKKIGKIMPTKNEVNSKIGKIDKKYNENVKLLRTENEKARSVKKSWRSGGSPEDGELFDSVEIVKRNMIKLKKKTEVRQEKLLQEMDIALRGILKNKKKE